MLPGRRESWRADPRAGMLVLVAGVALAGFFAITAGLLLAPAFVELDVAVSAAIRGLTAPGLEPAARLVTHLGDFAVVATLTVLTAAVLFARGRRVEAALVIVAVAGGALLGFGLKELFMRMRPALDVARIPLPETYSFPSGHALASVLYLGSLVFVAFLDIRRLGVAVPVVAGCTLVALAIAFSRVYLGVHYLGDVIGAWFLAAGWLALVVLVAARWGAGQDAEEVRSRDGA